MKWLQIDKYHLKCKQGDLTYYISKSTIYDKVIYELWNGNNWLYKDNDLEKVKRYAERYYQELHVA